MTNKTQTAGQTATESVGVADEQMIKQDICKCGHSRGLHKEIGNLNTGKWTYYCIGRINLKRCKCKRFKHE